MWFLPPDPVEIFTVQPDGTGLPQLTQFGGTATTPKYSPDGAHLVFSVDDQGIYLMNADGTGTHQVRGPEGQASWTPDGQHLVYECGDCAGGDGIFLMRADGPNAPGLRLSRNPYPDEGDANPEVSPDGQTVTFVRHHVDGELQALFAVDVDGTN